MKLQHILLCDVLCNLRFFAKAKISKNDYFACDKILPGFQGCLSDKLTFVRQRSMLAIPILTPLTGVKFLPFSAGSFRGNCANFGCFNRTSVWFMQ